MSVKTYKTLLIALAFLIIGCSDFKAIDSGGTFNPLIASQKGIEPGVVKQSQILRGYSSCLNLPVENISEATKNNYNNLKGNLSAEGYSNSLSAPLLMAVTQIAGDICNDLINYEKGKDSKKYFSGFNLEEESTQGSANYENLVSSLARSCWGREASEDEKQYIVTEFNKTSLQNTKGSRAALFLCTTALSVPEVVIY